jgi:type II secretory ATPase GspE/PulE/Tfp pilus assembly ATPase PilB-like protein
LFELFVIDEELRGLILSRAPVSVLKKMGRAHGMKTLLDDGRAKVEAGQTSMAEVLRVTEEF